MIPCLHQPKHCSTWCRVELCKRACPFSLLPCTSTTLRVRLSAHIDGLYKHNSYVWDRLLTLMACTSITATCETVSSHWWPVQAQQQLRVRPSAHIDGLYKHNNSYVWDRLLTLMACTSTTLRVRPSAHIDGLYKHNSYVWDRLLTLMACRSATTAKCETICSHWWPVQA